MRVFLLLAAASAAAAFSPASFILPASHTAAKFGSHAAYSGATPARVELGNGNVQRRAQLRPVTAAGGLRMADSYGVVITGAAGGVGFAYADEFLGRGHKVVIGDVSPKLSEAANALRMKHPNGQVFETRLDVSDKASVEAFANFAKDNLGTINYWINNAGINGGRKPFVDLTTGQLEAVVKVNLLGSLLCTQAALKLLKEQRGVKSHVFNTVGSGVKGGGTPGYASYGATKRGLPQFTQSLVTELNPETKGQKDFVVPIADDAEVGVHTLSPGMVFTNLLLDDSTPDLRKFFDVLASEPEEVAADLVPKILSTSGTGTSVEYLTPDKVVTRLFTGFVLGMRGRNFDKETGERIQKDGAKYGDNGVRVLTE